MNITYNGKMINVEGYIERKERQNGVKGQEEKVEATEALKEAKTVISIWCWI